MAAAATWLRNINVDLETDTLQDVITLMTSTKSTACAVTTSSDASLYGLLTESDVVFAAHAHALNKRAPSSVMVKDVVRRSKLEKGVIGVAALSDSYQQFAVQMGIAKIKHLPIMQSDGHGGERFLGVMDSITAVKEIMNNRSADEWIGAAARCVDPTDRASAQPVRQGATVGEALAIMKRVGKKALIVTPSDTSYKLVGIVSLADVLRRAIAPDAGRLQWHHLPVTQIMTPGEKCKTMTSFNTMDALPAMIAGGFRHMPVVRERDTGISIFSFLFGSSGGSAEDGLPEVCGMLDISGVLKGMALHWHKCNDARRAAIASPDSTRRAQTGAGKSQRKAPAASHAGGASSRTGTGRDEEEDDERGFGTPTETADEDGGDADSHSSGTGGSSSAAAVVVATHGGVAPGRRGSTATADGAFSLPSAVAAPGLPREMAANRILLNATRARSRSLLQGFSADDAPLGPGNAAVRGARSGSVVSHGMPVSGVAGSVASSARARSASIEAADEHGDASSAPTVHRIVFDASDPADQRLVSKLALIKRRVQRYFKDHATFQPDRAVGAQPVQAKLDRMLSIGRQLIADALEDCADEPGLERALTKELQDATAVGWDSGRGGRILVLASAVSHMHAAMTSAYIACNQDDDVVMVAANAAASATSRLWFVCERLQEAGLYRCANLKPAGAAADADDAFAVGDYLAHDTSVALASGEHGGTRAATEMLPQLDAAYFVVPHPSAAFCTLLAQVSRLLSTSSKASAHEFMRHAACGGEFAAAADAASAHACTLTSTASHFFELGNSWAPVVRELCAVEIGLGAAAQPLAAGKSSLSLSLRLDDVRSAQEQLLGLAKVCVRNMHVGAARILLRVAGGVALAATVSASAAGDGAITEDTTSAMLDAACGAINTLFQLAAAESERGGTVAADALSALQQVAIPLSQAANAYAAHIQLPLADLIGRKAQMRHLARFVPAAAAAASSTIGKQAAPHPDAASVPECAAPFALITAALATELTEAALVPSACLHTLQSQCFLVQAVCGWRTHPQLAKMLALVSSAPSPAADRHVLAALNGPPTATVVSAAAADSSRRERNPFKVPYDIAAAALELVGQARTASVRALESARRDAASASTAVLSAACATAGLCTAFSVLIESAPVLLSCCSLARSSRADVAYGGERRGEAVGRAKELHARVAWLQHAVSAQQRALEAAAAAFTHNPAVTEARGLHEPPLAIFASLYRALGDQLLEGMQKEEENAAASTAATSVPAAIPDGKAPGAAAGACVTPPPLKSAAGAGVGAPTMPPLTDAAARRRQLAAARAAKAAATAAE